MIIQKGKVKGNIYKTINIFFIYKYILLQHIKYISITNNK